MREKDSETGRAAAPRDWKTGRADERPKKVREVVVPVWQGPVDWRAVEPRLLAIMRARDARCPLTEAEMARRLDMDRRLLHKLHEGMKACTIPMLCRWCNGRHLDPAYFLYVAVESLRQEAETRRSRKQARMCPR